MLAILKNTSCDTLLSSVEQKLLFHPAWIGEEVSGLEAEKMLRNRNISFLYVLRPGELEHNYYVTYVSSDMSIRHQPFTLSQTSEGWCYENGGTGGPYDDRMNINNVIHAIMHCEKDECIPFTPILKK